MKKVFVVFWVCILLGLAVLTYRENLNVDVQPSEILQNDDSGDPIPANVTIRTLDAKMPTVIPDRPSPTRISQSTETIVSATQTGLQAENEGSLPAEGNLDVAIFDLLDEPIPTGSIIIDGATYRFSDGRFRQKNTTPGVHTLIVQADSYQPSSKQITYPNEKTVPFQLDYVFSPEIHVVDPARSNAPVADATVYLWIGNKAPRPIESRARIPLDCIIMPSEIAREGNQIRIVNKTRGLSSLFYVNGPSWVLTGDTIVSYGRTAWDERKMPSKEYKKEKNNSFIPLSDFRSRKVKLWDSMCLFGMGKKTSGLTENPMREFMEMDREGIRFYTFLRIQYDEFTSEPQVVGYTDGNGNFTFTDLLPGIYYVQVQKEGALSDRLPIAPCYNGTNLFLSNQSTASIRVYCKGANYEANEMNSVKNASVSLKGIDTAGLFTAMTDKRGRAAFKEIPIGNYRATISPPDDIPSAPIQQDIRVCKKTEIYNFYFDNWDAWQISGVVLTSQDRKPVPNYDMILSGYLGTLLRQKTDAEGKFVFLLRKNVTVTNADTFCLYGYTPLDETAEYLPASGYPGETFLLKCKFGNYDTSMNFFRFDPQKDNLTNFEYLVDPIIQTHFSGVVTKSGVPVENAKVAIFSSRASHMSLDIFEGNDVTDRNGNFNVTVRGRESDYVFEDGIVIASIERSSYTLTKDNQGEDLSYESSPIAIATGSKAIQFQSGDTISNINIEISEESTCEVQGVIDNIHEFSFDDIVIEFVQNDRTYQVDLDPAGNFSMKGLNPGVAYLSIRPGRRIIDHPKYGTQQNGDFIYQYIRLTIPDHEKTLFVGLKLLKAGYLAGVVVDANRRVVENATIGTTHFDHRAVEIQTKADGLFWIPNLYLNSTYTLTAVKDNLRAKIENIQPNDENILLILR